MPPFAPLLTRGCRPFACQGVARPRRGHRRLHAAQPTSSCSTTDVCMQHALPARCPQGGRLLEKNLMAAPHVADDIMANDMLTQEPAHPDRHQGHGPHQPAQQLRHVRHRLSPSARSCTRRRSSSSRRPSEAAKALIDYITSIERATELAEAHQEGRGLGDAWQGAAAAIARQEAMQSFIRANYATEFFAVRSRGRSHVLPRRLLAK